MKRQLAHRLATLLSEAVDQVGARMQATSSEHGPPGPGSRLAQAGLADGAQIVIDYLTVNEFGLALEHLIYMIEEADLAIDADGRASLREAAELMGIDPARLDRAGQRQDRDTGAPAKPRDT